ncbi:MAG: AsmA family protein [Gammaproteobacteria bacterium]|nr:AsmA family protein [Gammaproteobacteria bacterium]
MGSELCSNGGGRHRGRHDHRACMPPLRRFDISRRLLIGAVLLLGLILTVIGTLALMLRPAALQARIERSVRAATGLVLHIDGEVRWQIWPYPKLTIGAARVERAAANAGTGSARISAAPLAAWRILSAAARWSPLLRGELRLDTLTIDGVALTLVRDAQGTIHWPAIAPAATTAAAADRAGPGRAIAIGHLAVDNGVIRLLNGRGAPIASVDGFGMQAGVDYDPAAGRLRLAHPVVRAIAHGGTLAAGGLRIALDAPALAIQHKPLRLESPRLHASIGTLEARLRFDGPVDLATPAGAGDLRIATASLRQLALEFGTELPPTRDPAVFGPLELQVRWRTDAAGVALDGLIAKLDGNRYAGSASVPAGGPAAGQPARFALQGDTLDLRRYLRPEDQPGEPFTLPVDWLRAQHVEGVLELGQAHVGVGVLHGVKIRVLDQAPATAARTRQ